MTITLQMLRLRIKRHNERRNLPNDPFNSIFQPIEGVWCLVKGNTGYCVEIMHAGGGCSTLCNTGYVTKQELWLVVTSYINGWRDGVQTC